MIDEIMQELEKIGVEIDQLIQKAEKAVAPEVDRAKEKYKGSEAEKIVNNAKKGLEDLAKELEKTFK
jgi:glutamyl-tRNA reductase